MDRGDLAAAAADFTSDAEVSMPWLLLGGTTCCKGLNQIRSALQTTVTRDHSRFTVLMVAPGGSGVTARVEARTPLTADPRFGRAILTVVATFAGEKIARLEQRFDLSDPITARVARYKPLVEAVNAPPTPTPSPGPPFTPAWREIAAPPNGDIPNTQWIELDAPGNHKLIAAVQQPSGPGPFPVVVFLHGGGGLTRAMRAMTTDSAATRTDAQPEKNGARSEKTDETAFPQRIADVIAILATARTRRIRGANGSRSPEAEPARVQP